MAISRFDRIRQAKPVILPSLLNSHFGDLRGEVERLEAAGTIGLHLDVMDGHFVPNLTFGMPIVKGLRRLTDLPLDVHLMISDPLKYAKPMVEAGADSLTFHIEAVDDPGATVQSIRDLGVGVGVAINPSTPMDRLDAVLDLVDLALVMSVEAGFGGQSFNPISLERVRSIRRTHPELLLQMDGGINLDTIASAYQAGCDLFVVGSAIFRSEDYTATIQMLEEQLHSGSTH